MYCPKCKSTNLKVIDSVNPNTNYAKEREKRFRKSIIFKIFINRILRRRQCKICKHKWNTIEIKMSDIERFIIKS